MKKPKSDYAIQTVSNALRLLEAFQEREELGVTALSQRLALHKNNVFRLLATLQQSGYIEQDEASGLYRLGVRCFELGQSFSRSGNLLRRGRAALEALARETGESVHLGILDDLDVVHLDGEGGRGLVRGASRVGWRLPAHCTALGKVLLGCGDEARRAALDLRLGAGSSLEARTAATITDRDKFFEHLRGVKVQGFGMDLEECEVGLCCVAAPVHDARGGLVAAISVSPPSFRADEGALRRDFAPAVTAAAERLSEQLGAGAPA